MDCPASLNLNERAWRLADELTHDAASHGVSVTTVGGARVIDAGVKQPGSLAAGVMLGRICLADLGSVTLAPMTVAGRPLPGVAVEVRQPVAACMASQYAGWQLQAGKFFAMGSGPFRAAYGKEKLYDDIGCRERAPRVVGVLETGKLPDEAVVQLIAEKCQVAPDAITLLAARTASLAGGVQVVARSVETALHKLHELHFDLTQVVAGYGVAPVPPVAKDDLAAIGRTNDAVLYGGQVTLYLRGDDAALATVGAQLPSSASRDYGQTFAKLFARYDHDFYKIDPLLFSPALVSLHHLDTGRVHTFGQLNEALLVESFFG